ncbi:hypothetical protein CC79DRAFT_1336959 [Sarocladium strictum]
MSAAEEAKLPAPQLSNTNSRLLRLPFELRHLIIQLALFSTAPKGPEDCGHRRRLGRDDRDSETQIATEIFTAPAPSRALLATCHQLREDTISTLQSVGKRGEYHLDVMFIKNMGLFPTWIIPPPPSKRHVDTLYTTIRMFARPEGFDPEWLRPPWFRYLQRPDDHIWAYSDLFASYCEYGPQLTSVVRGAMRANYTIGTLILDVVPTDASNFHVSEDNEPAPRRKTETTLPLHAPLALYRDVDNEDSSWPQYWRDFSTAEEQFPFESIGWYIHWAIDKIHHYQHERFVDLIRPLLDGVCVVDVRVNGEKRQSVELWEIVEHADRLPILPDGREWMVGAQERRKQRGVWVGEGD